MQSSRAPSERDRIPRNALLFLVRCESGTVCRPAPPLTAVPRSRHPLPARSDLHTTDRNSSTGGFPHHPTPILHPVRTAPTAADRRRPLPASFPKNTYGRSAEDRPYESGSKQDHIFLPTLVFLATFAAPAFVAPPALAATFLGFASTIFASSTASAYLAAGLRERRVLGFASTACAAGVTPSV